MYFEHKKVKPNEVISMMNATELYEALIEMGLTNSQEYQEEVLPQIDTAMNLHPEVTFDEIAETFIDDILDIEDVLEDVNVEILYVEDYVGTDYGYYDCSFVLGYRIAGAYSCKCGAHFVKTENHNYCGHCGAKI